MVCEEENGVLCIVIFSSQNSFTKACEIVGRLGNEHVRERSMSKLEKEARAVYIPLTTSLRSHRRKNLQRLITSDAESSLHESAQTGEAASIPKDPHEKLVVQPLSRY